MKARFTMLSAALVAAVALVPSAKASVILDASYQGLTGQSVEVIYNGVSSNVQAGLMQFSLQSDTDLSVLPFELNGMSVDTFCVEFTQSVKSGWQSYHLLEASQVFSANQTQAIERLYTAYHQEVDNSNSKAAFQLALWEIVHEETEVWNITQGSFRARPNRDIGGLANQWLFSLDSIESQYNLYVMTNADSQNQLVFSGVPIPSSTPVPVPATLGLFGLGALLLLRRRK